ncbi:transposase domain-containing protein, partial [Escherichia coli]|uniref:transposase domain-containing protein n=1 Tax=Escherichia coli TaxID=562 RepID=UPI00201FDF35
WLDNCFRSIEEVSAWLSRLTLWYNQEQKCKGINDEHAAVLYSLIGTCRLNNVEPEKWLRYVIEHIQDWPANRVRDLLP